MVGSLAEEMVEKRNQGKKAANTRPGEGRLIGKPGDAAEEW